MSGTVNEDAHTRAQRELLNYRAPKDLLRGCTVLVTGAADGIGRAVAKAFAGHGATVLILDRKRRKLETLYDEIIALGCTEPAIVVQDFLELDEAAARNVCLGIGHDFGRLEGLVHAATEFAGLKALHNIDAPQWSRAMQGNLTAPFLLTRAVLPLLKTASDASVVFSSAAVGRHGKAFWGAYGVACAGIESLAKIWSEELDTHSSVRVNTLDPGPVRTPLRELAYPGEDANRLPTPEDVVPAYLYLMGSDSRGVNGQVLSAQVSP
ncbi:MAG: SDR family NAD(P)-dependent oxidoreductase [Gammaproteobacteria bacterium]|nr:SDR family NAD(P)-dependent oxidoreductase [Gammaproteobacteria bacterium]